MSFSAPARSTPLLQSTLHDLTQVAPNRLISVGIEVGKRDPGRPRGTVKAASVEQDGAGVLGKPNHDVERIVVRGNVGGEFLAEGLTSPDFQIKVYVISDS